MIHLTKLNGDRFVLNVDWIKQLEATPDTTITLITNERLMVLEPVDEVVDRSIEYRRRCGSPPLPAAIDRVVPVRLPSGRLLEEAPAAAPLLAEGAEEDAP